MAPAQAAVSYDRRAGKDCCGTPRLALGGVMGPGQQAPVVASSPGERLDQTALVLSLRTAEWDSLETTRRTSALSLSRLGGPAARSRRPARADSLTVFKNPPHAPPFPVKRKSRPKSQIPKRSHHAPHRIPRLEKRYIVHRFLHTGNVAFSEIYSTGSVPVSGTAYNVPVQL